MVYGTKCDHTLGWHLAIWLHIDWDVFHIHLILDIQNLLCIWFHASSFPYRNRSHNLCDHSLHLHITQRRRLQVVSIQWTFLVSILSLTNIVMFWILTIFVPQLYHSIIFTIEIWQAMDIISDRSINLILCVFIFFLLLLFQDENVWSLSDGILLWTHGLIQSCARYHVWRYWICRY